MGRSQYNPRLVHNTEDVQRIQALSETLCAVIRPHVLPILAIRVEQEMRSPPPPLTDEQIAWFARSGASSTADAESDEANQIQKVVSDALRNPEPVTNETIAATVQETIDREVGRLVSAWLSILHLAAGNCYAGRTLLDLASLNDAMLPELRSDLLATFDDCFAPFYLTPDDARVVLRIVRAALPLGKRLPDEAVEILALWHVAIR